MIGFIALCILAVIHLFANQINVFGWVWKGNFLSFASGISFAYVFVDLLPELEKGQPTLKQTFYNIIPYFDKHAYVISLLGVLFYYGIHTSKENSTKSLWFAVIGYLIFNFFVGASLSDSNDPDIQPVALFTLAMGMHYFVRDHNEELDNPEIYHKKVRWLLVIALFFGYFVGYITRIPNALVAVLISFLSGGVFLNALRYELPKRERIGYFFFVSGAIIYTLIILGVGNI